MTTATTVLIADDQPLLRHSLAQVIDAEPDLTVCGHAAHGDEAIRLVREHHPAVVVMDIRMPGTDGITATRIMTSDPTLSKTRVLMLTTFDHDEYIEGALRAGASGFVLKDAHPEQLADAIRRTRDGETWLAPQVLTRLVDHYLSSPNGFVVSEPTGLTPRETEILVFVAHGLTNTEIAQKLVISHKTVKTHISHLLRKLDARDRAALIITAYRLGIVHGMPSI